ncbi:MAG TPA: ABC transporter ATP-binding protein [Alphaproteobacteria bacterium]
MSKHAPFTASMPLLRRVFRDYLWAHRYNIAFALSLMVLSAGMVALQVWILQDVIDKIFVAKQASYLLPLGLGVILIFVVNGFANWGHTVLLAKTSFAVVTELQHQLFNNMLQQDLRYYHERSSGQLSSYLISDIIQLRGSMIEGVMAIVKNIFTLVFLVGVMFSRNPKLALLAFIIFPPTGYFVAHVGKKLRRIAGSTQNDIAQFSGLLNQSFQGIRQVKSYTAEGHERTRIGRYIDSINRLSMKSVRTSTLTIPLSECLAGAAIALVIFYGGSQVITGQNTTGNFFSFIAAFFMAYEPMKRLAKSNNTMQVGLAATQRVFEALDHRPEIISPADAPALVIKNPNITFENVSFTYPDGTMALQDFSAVIQAGKKTALVGPSGSGKSTLLQLLLRFYDVNQGRILIDGQDIRQVDISSLRQHLGFVSQDIFIFDDSVSANIAYGVQHAQEKEIQNAATQAAAHSFIQRLENGYQTRLGEFGVRLSGGQKQRIAIARAILKNAPILLLDEATSALDTESEQLVTEALNHLQAGRTTLVVAHRLTTIKDADEILVLQNGRLIAQGTHDQLLSQPGLYPSLYAGIER